MTLGQSLDPPVLSRSEMKSPLQVTYKKVCKKEVAHMKHPTVLSRVRVRDKEVALLSLGGNACRSLEAQHGSCLPPPLGHRE